MEEKAIAKTEPKKKEDAKKKKTFAIANGMGLPISFKEGADICSMIRGKSIDEALKRVEEVLAMKRVVKMNKRECAHQHGKGVCAGRYPLKACGEFLRVLKQLKANAMHNELELEKCRISLAMCSQASRPYKRGGARTKRSHVFLKLEMKKQEAKKEEKKEGKKESK